MRVLDLFSGIGGFSLGLERAGGFKTVAFCEIDPFARAVLAQHWPGVPIFGDIRTLTAKTLAEATAALDRCEIDVICGGFPCQDISLAGEGAGLAGERSGLWREYARLIGEIRPRYVIVENVAALLSRGLGDVLADLAALGYDAEWHCIPASYVGAPHRRDRVWIVAYPGGEQHQGAGNAQRGQAATGLLEAAMGYADRQGSQVSRPQPVRADWLQEWRSTTAADWWSVEPDVGRVAHGVPARVDRLRGLGNAVVPQVVEMIGRAVMRAAGEGGSQS